MASDDLTEMVWEKMWVGRPGGTHLSQSRTPGGSSPLVRGDGTNKLETHVTLFPARDEDERDSSATVLKVVIGVAVGVVGTIVAIKAAPHIKSRLSDLKSKWNGSSEMSEADSQAATAEMAALSSAASADFSNEVDVALEEHGTRMSSAEAQKRLLALLTAAAFIADQMRALASARIEDDDPSLKLKSAMEKLAAPQITDSINRVLETNSSLLDEETSAEFVKIFGGGRIVDGQYVPLRNEKIKEALRLTGGEA
ncbi:hypothetical protein ACIRQP_39110 [Streptomyces sp. NPDC102274]|uniref:hypothetical protein n=1 Tax=Streptomyces sp. NPDC102274 TaxID=3366151 RepID=UPI00382E2B42